MRTQQRLLGLSTAAAALTLITLFTPGEARADTCNGRDALVADLGLHVVAIGYQHTLDCQLTLQASAGLYAPWTVDKDVLDLGGGNREAAADIRGGMIRGRFFAFPWGKAPTGPWLSPFAQVGFASGTVNDESLSGAAFAAGASLGYTFELGPRWLLGLGLGGQYHLVSLDRSTDYPGFLRFGPTVDINVDYAF